MISPVPPARFSALRRPAAAMLLMLALLALGGCSLLPGSSNGSANTDDGTIESTAPADARDAFILEIIAPDEEKRFLERHLNIRRFRNLPDLGEEELERLGNDAVEDARRLLSTLGYFSAGVSTSVQPEPPQGPARFRVTLTVEPGPRAKVTEADIRFTGAIEADAASNRRVRVQKRTAQSAWALNPGDDFTQNAWAASKKNALEKLTTRRYLAARIEDSQATIDPQQASASLSVTYDSGPPFRLGEMQVHGSTRYPPEIAPRLASIPHGAEYDQERLLEAQARMAASGYYDSVFLSVDPGTDTPEAAPVIAQVRDAKFQKVVFGIGISTDVGLNLSASHAHNQMPVLGWRAVSRIALDDKNKIISTNWVAPPEASGWRWTTGAAVQRETTGSYEVNSLNARGGRRKDTDHIERSYFVQYDHAQGLGSGAPPSATAISVHHNWLGRYFNSNINPTRGMALATEVGVGTTLLQGNDPFVRLYSRWMSFIPLGISRAAAADEPMQRIARRSRLAVRLEGGAVIAPDNAAIPSNLLFLTGGDTTVRGYGFRKIGARLEGGSIFAGRYMGVASLEWQRPIIRDNRLTAWEHVLFVDMGGVADEIGDLRAKTGVGTGVRWRSPVGPIQADLAYGIDARDIRLHIRMGFSF